MKYELKLGAKIFSTNLIQGPLAGYTNSAMRYLIWKYGSPAFCCTEMISACALAHGQKKTIEHYLAKNPHEGPACFQLFGSDPQELAVATKIATDAGADLIDLNCGCPVRKVRMQNSGSSLLADPTKIYHLITAMKQNTPVPVSIKIRVEGNGKTKFHDEMIKVVNESGVDFLVVHGRHWNETYNMPVHYEQIQFFVEKVKVPVIGNGDVADINSLRKMLATGCSGVMIGRAGIGQPWLTKKLIAELNAEEFNVPTLKEIGGIFLDHVSLLVDLFGSEKLAILHIRKMTKQYTRGFENNKDFCIAVNSCESLRDLEKISRDYFGCNSPAIY